MRNRADMVLVARGLFESRTRAQAAIAVVSDAEAAVWSAAFARCGALMSVASSGGHAAAAPHAARSPRLRAPGNSLKLYLQRVSVGVGRGVKLHRRGRRCDNDLAGDS
jgi:hypothetical protein